MITSRNVLKQFVRQCWAPKGRCLPECSSGWVSSIVTEFKMKCVVQTTEMRNYTCTLQDTYINTCVIVVLFPRHDLYHGWTTEVKVALILSQITVVIMCALFSLKNLYCMSLCLPNLTSFYLSRKLLKNPRRETNVPHLCSVWSSFTGA